jgi:hypothetical protein
MKIFTSLAWYSHENPESDTKILNTVFISTPDENIHVLSMVLTRKS